MKNANHIISSSAPTLFEEYFELGMEEAASPFLAVDSRRWGIYLSLKASIFAAILLTVSFILSFFPQYLAFSYLMLVGVYFLVGVPALIESLEELANFTINIDILMTLAAFSSVLIGSGFEGGLLLVLFALSGSMEDFVTSKAKGNISSLHKLSPTKACVVEADGTILERSIRDVPRNAHILVKAGQIIPLDGIVTEGASSVNLVHLTGENMPIPKFVGDEVHAGARNLEGALLVKVTRTSVDSTLSHIIHLVTQAQEERPVLQRWFDKLSQAYAISIISLSFLFAVTLPFIFSIPFLGVEGSVYRSLAFLIAASPCALIIAIPIAYLSAIGVCAKQGVLLKGGITLDALARCTTIAFDKTGTLTTGQLELVGIDSIHISTSENKEQALAIAYSMERNALHPIAKAIVEYGQSKKISLVPLNNFRAVPGFGLNASIFKEKEEIDVFIGRPEYILPRLDNTLSEKLRKSCISPQENREVIAILSIGPDLYMLRFSDTLRPKIASTIKELKRNMHVVMLSGDHAENVKKVAGELGIEEAYGDLTPEDKLTFISTEAAEKGIAMVGDGINDAPALARATVGICMGKVGSTPAIDAAEIILLRDNIETVGWLIKKAKQTRTIVNQNLFLATMAIIVASSPALMGWIPLWVAVVMHEGGTVLVGLNGLRLLKK